jgi:hypothetical protein
MNLDVSQRLKGTLQCQQKRWQTTFSRPKLISSTLGIFTADVINQVAIGVVLALMGKAALERATSRLPQETKLSASPRVQGSSRENPYSITARKVALAKCQICQSPESKH